MEIENKFINVSDFGDFLLYLLNCFQILCNKSGKTYGFDEEYSFPPPCWLVSHMIVASWIGKQDIQNYRLDSFSNKSEHFIFDIYLKLSRGYILEITYDSPADHWFVLFPLSDGRVYFFDNKKLKYQDFQIIQFSSVVKCCLELKRIFEGRKKDFFYEEFCNPKENDIVCFIYSNKNGTDWDLAHKEMIKKRQLSIKELNVWDIETFY